MPSPAICPPSSLVFDVWGGSDTQAACLSAQVTKSVMLHSASMLLLVWFVMGLGTGMEERTAAVLAGATQDLSAEELQPAMQPMPAWPLPREGYESNEVRVRFFRPMHGHGICRIKLIDIVVDVDGFWRVGAWPMSGEELFLSLYVDGSLVGTRLLGNELQEPAEEHLVEGPRIHLLWTSPVLEGPSLERPASFQVLLRQESPSTTWGSTGTPSGRTWSQEVRVKLVAEPALCKEHRHEALRLSREDSRWIAQPRGDMTGTPAPPNATIIFPQSNTVHALSSRARLLYEFQAPAGGDECALVLWVNRIPVWYHIQPPLDEDLRLPMEIRQILLFPDFVSEPGWSELCLTLHHGEHLTQLRRGSFDDRNFFYERLGQSCAMALYDEATKLAKVGDIARSSSSQCELAMPLACKAGNKGLQCSGRGECHPLGWCECDDWSFGERCEHDMMMATSVMLHPVGSRAGGDKCPGTLSRAFQMHSNQRWAHEAENLAGLLQEWEMTAWTDSTIIGFENEDADEQGVGAQVLFLMNALAHALYFWKGAAILHPSSTDLNYPWCDQEVKSACFFRSPFFAGVSRDSQQEAVFEVFDRPNKHVLPAFEDMGRLWWQAQLASYIMQTSYVAEKKVRRVELAIGFETPCIGVHLRLGNNCSFEDHRSEWYSSSAASGCKQAFQSYTQAVMDMKAAYGLKTAFVAADSTGAGVQLEQALAGQGVRVVRAHLGSHLHTAANFNSWQPITENVARESGLIGRAPSPKHEISCIFLHHTTHLLHSLCF